MNIVITVRAINIVEGSAIDPPRWNNRDCSESLNTQLDNLASWEPDSEQVYWILSASGACFVTFALPLGIVACI